MNVYLTALGCRLNEAELSSWVSEFNQSGHVVVPHAEEADLMVFNTCAVTAEAGRKSRQKIKRLHRTNPSSKLVVSGCYVTLNQQEATECLGVDLVVENSNKDRLMQISNDLLDLPTMPEIASNPDEAALFTRNRQRAFIKIQDGCRYRCSFCIVTVARGSERSRTVTEIVDEVNNYVRLGIQEIVLTGVHVGGYGSDINSNLFSLVKSLLAETDVKRIRFASVEPWDIPTDFFTLFENPRMMPHMHLPLQSGSDAILRKMSRRCKTKDFRSLVQHIKSQLPDFNITTDIIAGFPGETELDWENTLAFVKEMMFSHIHIFSYSPRTGTKAATLPGQIDKPTKRVRSQELHRLAKQIKAQALKKALNKNHTILWEGRTSQKIPGVSSFSGYTPNYLRVRTDVPDTVDLTNTLTNFIPERLSHDAQLIVGKHT